MPKVKYLMSQLILWNMPATYDSTASAVRPLGPHKLASWLRQNGYAVKVIDFAGCMSLSDLVAITERWIDHSTLAIGVSTTFFPNEDPQDRSSGQAIEQAMPMPDWLSAGQAAVAAKYPGLRWVMGGTRVNQFLQPGWTGFTGAGEDQMLAWLDETSQASGQTRPRFDITTSCGPVFTDDDHIDRWEVIPIELGRGCMFRCRFCSYEYLGKTPGTYLRSADSIRAEIMHYHERWGVTRFYYIDDTVNETVDKVRMLRDIAASVPFRLEWIGYIRADLVWARPETEQLLLESGLRSTFIGIESFESNSSKLIGKGWSGLHGKEWLLKMQQRWEGKINWALGLIVGLPGQTEAQLEADGQWLIDNNMNNWRWAALWISPGMFESEFSRNSQKYGFSFPDPTQSWEWAHQESGWNLTKARKLVMKYTRAHRPLMKQAAWPLGDWASLGFELDLLMQENCKTSSYLPILADRKLAFVANYVAHSLA